MQDYSQTLSAIYAKIVAKADIYKAIIQKSFKVGPDEADNIFPGELENFMTRLDMYLTDQANHKSGSPTITDAQGVNIFLEVMQSGLSFSKIANHVYVSRMKGTGTAVGYKVTADGEIFQAQRSGAIDHLSEPVLVLQGEQFSIRNTADGRQVADHTLIFNQRPKFSMAMFLAGYIYIVYPNGDRELSWISAERMKELQSKSASPSNYNDESFVQTKVIKHALRKVRKSAFTQQRQASEDDNDTSSWTTAEPEPPMIEQPQAAYVPQPAPVYRPTMIVDAPHNEPWGLQYAPQQMTNQISEPF